MTKLKQLMGSALLLLALSASAHADVTVSHSNDPTAAVGGSLVALLGQEHAALGTVSGARLKAIVATPAAKAKGAAPALTYDNAWLSALPAASGGADFDCLANVLYFEARGESIKGQAAVAEVVLNRVDSGVFPSTVCGVVRQSNGGGCQFSWVCDGASDIPRNREAYVRAAKIARAMLDGAPRQLTGGATYFHTPSVRPSWARAFTKTIQIGAHIFYRAPVTSASS